MSGAEYLRSDQSSLSMSFRRCLLQLPSSGEIQIARTVGRRRAIVICALMLGSLQLSPVTSQSLVPESNSTVAEEPITPIPEPATTDPLKIKLGERLFGDPRLSHNNSRSCSSCHDLRTNGASLKSQDIGLDGSSLPLNTLTIFNAALNFRFG
jgi:cytochrome c peroxidase